MKKGRWKVAERSRGKRRGKREGEMEDGTEGDGETKRAISREMER